MSGFKIYVAVTHDNSTYTAPNGQTIFDQTFVDFLSGGTIDGEQVYHDNINLRLVKHSLKFLIGLWMMIGQMIQEFLGA